jgi:hypothetical protein
MVAEIQTTSSCAYHQRLLAHKLLGFESMQQLSAMNSPSTYPSTMKAMVRSALDPNVKSGAFDLFGKEGFGFKDIVDAVNPLQHIPGVSSLYREATGDGVSPAISLASGALLGGPVGFLVAAISTGFELATGDSPVGHLFAALTEEKPAAVQVASLYQKAYKLT